VVAKLARSSAATRWCRSNLFILLWYSASLHRGLHDVYLNERDRLKAPRAAEALRRAPEMAVVDERLAREIHDGLGGGALLVVIQSEYPAST